MLKKFIIVLVSLAFLTACGQKVKVEFEPPATGPDPDRFQPAYGPNDPPPIAEPNF